LVRCNVSLASGSKLDVVRCPKLVVPLMHLMQKGGEGGKREEARVSNCMRGSCMVQLQDIQTSHALVHTTHTHSNTTQCSSGRVIIKLFSSWRSTTQRAREPCR
jgi:hypothetical protein